MPFIEVNKPTYHIMNFIMSIISGIGIGIGFVIGQWLMGFVIKAKQ